MRKLCFLAALCSPFAQAEVVSVEANSMMRLPANVSVLRLEKLDVADYGTLLIPAGITQVDIPFEMLHDPEAIANWPLTLSRDGARTPMPWLTRCLARSAAAV